MAALMVSELIFNNEQHNISLDLQYINLSCPRALLQITVDSHRKTANTIKESFTSSLRSDGSVDRTQVNN